jgi:hypothetical protein
MTIKRNNLIYCSNQEVKLKMLSMLLHGMPNYNTTNFFLSPNASGSFSGLTQTLALGIMNRVFYHCATTASREANFANLNEVKAAA